MKVTSKQRNSRMCVICGLDNPAGVRAPFYNMEDDSVRTIFSFKEVHQSYPGRVHGGLITAMLDELGCRALWVKDERNLAVTMSLNTKFRKPVPYLTELRGVGKIVTQTPRFFQAQSFIYDSFGTLLGEAELKFIKLPDEKVSVNASYHEEMCYLMEDGITEIK